MMCPSCKADNEDTAEVCFSCRAVLAAVTRGSVLEGRYEILSMLGRGGMGVVYKAHDRELDETVAVKLLRTEASHDSDMARRFRSEIKLARKVSHRNVCRIHEFGEDQGRRFISMEFVDGTDLKQVVRTSGGLPPADAFDAAIQTALGLEAIHEAGIVHRDLKTVNIMRDARGVIRLMDFGIAKQTGADATTGATATGQVIGTPEYMSPEQARGQKVDARTDLYALGVVLFEIFTGQVPFRGETPVATLFMHVQDAPPLEGPAAAKLPRPLLPVLRKALAKQPSERFASAKEMAQALCQAQAAFLSGATTPEPAEPVADPTPAPMTEATTLARPPTPAPTPKPASTDVDVDTSTVISAAPVPRPAPAQIETARPRPPRPAAPRPAQASRRGLWLAVAASAVVFIGLALLRTRPAGESILAPTTTLAVAEALPAVPTTLPAAPAPSDPSPRPVAAASATPIPAATGPATLARATPTPRPAAAQVRATVAPPPTTLPMLYLKPAPTPEPAPTPTPTPPPLAPTPTPAPPQGVVTAATAPPQAPATEDRGFLQLTVVPGAEATVDDVSLGQVQSTKVSLKAGAHVLVLNHPDYQSLRRKFTVASGETFRMVVDLAEEAVPKKK